MQQGGTYDFSSGYYDYFNTSLPEIMSSITEEVVVSTLEYNEGGSVADPFVGTYQLLFTPTSQDRSINQKNQFPVGMFIIFAIGPLPFAGVALMIGMLEF